MDMFYAFVVICNIGEPCTPSVPQLKFATHAECVVAAKKKVATEYITQPAYEAFKASGGKLHFGCVKRAANWDWAGDGFEGAQKVVKEVVGEKL